jgi:hypothetical protein
VQAESIARNRRNYYGVLMCSVIANLFSPDEIEGAVVFASYPPGDRRHKDDLEASLLGRWEFVNRRREYNVTVRQVVSYTEPLGGFWNWVILEAPDGRHYDNRDYDPDRATLVIDLGGGTMSMLPIGRARCRLSLSGLCSECFNSVARDVHRELRQTMRSVPSARVLDIACSTMHCKPGASMAAGCATDATRAPMFRGQWDACLPVSGRIRAVGGPMPYARSYSRAAAAPCRANTADAA